MSLRICKSHGSFGVNEDANAAPWPDVNSVQVAGNEQIILGALPEDTRELVASCATFRIMASAERPWTRFLRRTLPARIIAARPHVVCLCIGGNHFPNVFGDVEHMSFITWWNSHERAGFIFGLRFEVTTSANSSNVSKNVCTSTVFKVCWSRRIYK